MILLLSLEYCNLQSNVRCWVTMHCLRFACSLCIILICVFAVPVTLVCMKDHSLYKRAEFSDQALAGCRGRNSNCTRSISSKVERRDGAPCNVLTATLPARGHLVDSRNKVIRHKESHGAMEDILSHNADDSLGFLHRRSTDKSSESPGHSELVQPEPTESQPPPNSARQEDPPAEQSGPALGDPARPFATARQRTPSPQLANARLDSRAGHPVTLEHTFLSTPPSPRGNFAVEYAQASNDRWRHRSPPDFFAHSWQHRQQPPRPGLTSPNRLRQAVETHSDYSQRLGAHVNDSRFRERRLLGFLGPLLRQLERGATLVYSHCPSTPMAWNPRTMGPEVLGRRLQRLTCRARWLVDQHRARGLNDRELREAAAVAPELEALEREQLRREDVRNRLARSAEIEETAAQRPHTQRTDHTMTEDVRRQQQIQTQETHEPPPTQRDSGPQAISSSETATASPGDPRPQPSDRQRRQPRRQPLFMRPASPPLERILQPWERRDGPRSRRQRRHGRWPPSRSRSRSTPIEAHRWPWQRDHPSPSPVPRPPTAERRPREHSETSSESTLSLRKRSPEGSEEHAERHGAEAATSRVASPASGGAHAVGDDGRPRHAPPSPRRGGGPAADPPSALQRTASSPTTLTPFSTPPPFAPERENPADPPHQRTARPTRPVAPQEHLLQLPPSMDAPRPRAPRRATSHVGPPDGTGRPEGPEAPAGRDAHAAQLRHRLEALRRWAARNELTAFLRRARTRLEADSRELEARRRDGRAGPR